MPALAPAAARQARAPCAQAPQPFLIRRQDPLGILLACCRACVPWRAVSVGVGPVPILPVPILVRSTVSAGPWLSPCVGRLSVGGLARASDVADAQGFVLFYPRPLRPVRASAPLRKASTARQPTAHTGDRPRPPLPTGPPTQPLLNQYPAWRRLCRYSVGNSVFEYSVIMCVCLLLQDLLQSCSWWDP